MTAIAQRQQICNSASMSDQHRKRSKALSYWLRHAPEQGGITLDSGGWAETHAVLLALQREGLETSHDLLRAVVAENDKSRFELADDGQRIRARQGHSVAVEGSWEAAIPPPVLFHGTVERFLPAIMREGLAKQKRHHVHLSADIETATRVGSRRGSAVILVVDAAAMVAAGFTFALSSNGVWLVETVPPQFLRLHDHIQS
jgi:putative RNA 2'-phosphotransferase